MANFVAKGFLYIKDGRNIDMSSFKFLLHYEQSKPICNTV